MEFREALITLKNDFYKKCIKYADVEFICSDGCKVLANKCILANKSDYFDSKFEGRFESTRGKNIKMECNSLVLDYIVSLCYIDEKDYSGQIEIFVDTIIDKTNTLDNENENLIIESIQYMNMWFLKKCFNCTVKKYLNSTPNLSNALSLKKYDLDYWLDYIAKLLVEKLVYDPDTVSEDDFLYLIKNLRLNIFLDDHYKPLLFKFSNIVLNNLDYIVIKNNWSFLMGIYDKNLLFELIIKRVSKYVKFLNNEIVVYYSITSFNKSNISEIILNIPLIKGKKIYRLKNNEIKSYNIKRIEKIPINSQVNPQGIEYYYDFERRKYGEIYIISENDEKIKIDNNCIYIPNNLVLNKYNK